MAGFGGAVKLTGESEYRQALSQITQNLREISSQMKVVSSSYNDNDNSIEALTSKTDVLNKKLVEETNKLKTLQAQYQSMSKQYDDNEKKNADLIASYEKEKAKLEALKNTLGTSSKEYQTQEKVVLNMAKAVDTSTKNQNANAKALSDMRIQMNNAQVEINKTTDEIENLSKEMKKAENQSDDLGKAVEDSGKQAQKSSEGFTVFKGILANLGTEVIKGVVGALKSLTGALINVGKQAISSYAEFEQLVGGVETLFKDSADIVQGYANNAYKTAGLSANEYMSTITSFSAGLISSLDGDTKKAAEIGNMAITDMSDNANKMGTSMESIQNAYQGFAKQNYTMLDNLKLGYGGTKSEMERLLKEAEKISGIKYDISNLSDVYEAIHIIQTEMGITGTTAKEASSTIQGSLNAVGSAWKNLLTGVADENADFGQLVQNFVDSIITASNNLLPRIKQVVVGLGEMVGALLRDLLPAIIKEIPSLINETLPLINETIVNITNAITEALPLVVNAISDMLPLILNTIVGMLPSIVNSAVQIILSLVQGIGKALPSLVPAVVEAILTIVDTLLDNVDLIIDTGFQLLEGLIEGIINAIPVLIEKLPTIIEKIISTLMSLQYKIMEQGVQLLNQLAIGLIKAIPQLVAKIPQIISAIVKGFAGGMGDIKNIGINILKGIGEGLWEGMKALWETVKSIADTVVGWFKNLFGIHSPSKVFADTIGKNLALGIGEGFEDTMGEVATQMADSIPTEYNANYSSNNATSTMGYSIMVEAFKEALSEMKIILDDEVAGKFVRDTITSAIYNT